MKKCFDFDFQFISKIHLKIPEQIGSKYAKVVAFVCIMRSFR